MGSFADTTAPKTLPLLRYKSIDLETALLKDDHILQELTYPGLEQEFMEYLYSHRSDIKDLVARHLGLRSRDSCQLMESSCLQGSFNICLPISIKDPHYPAKRVMFRIPLPYKVGEANYPGNAEEKLGCELATYIWMRKHCPTVPIPSLLGFGFAGGPSFVVPRVVPFFRRITWHAKRFLSWVFRRPLPCPYIPQTFPQSLGHGYMILEYIEGDKGEMLSFTWNDRRHDNTRRANLFRGLSQIILSLARQTFPRIGSLTIDHQGYLNFSNRPLTLRLHHLENEAIPTNISRDQMYFTSDAYILDVLACYDNKLRHQPNSILDDLDGREQMAAVTVMRATHSHYLQRHYHQGPFVLMLTDLHHSNIFVDDDWNIKCIVDLEWACSQPVEMMRVPYWLTNQAVDNLQPGNADGLLEEYTRTHDEFLEIFEKEEEAMGEREPYPSKQLFAASFTDIIKTTWNNGGFWFFHAIENPKGLCTLFISHLLPRYSNHSSPGFEDAVYSYWDVDADQVIESKLKEKEDYNIKLRNMFAENVNI